MNPFAELPTWVAVLVALFAGGVLVALNLGWLMAAKSMLDGQRQKRQERGGGATPSTTTAASEVPREVPRQDRDASSSRTPII